MSLQLDGSIVPGLAPIARQFQPFAVHAPIASYQFTGAEPLGSYTWLSALTRPGTLELITEISQQPFQVMATPPRQITHTTITPAGGQAVLPNVAAITFAPGAFASPTSVAVESTSSAATATVFNETAAIFRPAGRLAYEVRVNTGATPPAGDTVAVGLSVPAALLAAMPANYQFDVFAQVYQDGGMDVHDTFELFAGVYDAATLTLNAVLPMQVFTNQRTADQTWEAILTIAATPGPLNAMTLSMQADQNSIAALLGPQAGTCQATSIACPLGGTDCTAALTSGYQLAGRTINGTTRPHYGADFGVPTGTQINAAADGVVERSYLSSSYGETIILRHSDGGATLYAHLQTRSVTPGQTVTRGSQIGVSDNTGRSTGPHLHLEYVPNGQIIQSRNRIDPLPCVGTTLNGAITVGDNGSAADDAFEIFLDGVRLGATSIGATNTLAANNLVSGNHILRIVGIVVPDNAGTLGVSLSQGLTFLGGGTTRSTTLPTGGEVSYTIIVP